MNLEDVEKMMFDPDRTEEFFRPDMKEEATKIASESQEIMDLISGSDRDDLDGVYKEMHEINDKAHQILEKLGE
ncbi:MAG: hypothetical protein HDQ88_02230 [Clostridia bacterium]|nr:hypothetical protein [Clostridia bacterium]